MIAGRAADIERGMALVPRLPEVTQHQADGKLGQVYDDVQQVLRVPFVNFVFRVLANYESYLVREWDRLEPWAGTLSFERAADALRQTVRLDTGSECAEADWAALGDLDRIRAFTSSIHYVLPKLLLLATAMDEALDPQRHQADPVASTGHIPGDDLPRGVAAGTLSIPMIDPDQADPALRETFDRIKRRHGHPEVATYYRSLGHWPAFLQAAWERIEPVVGTPAYKAAKRALLELALAEASSAARHGAYAPPCPARAPAPAEASDLRAALSVFCFRLIPDLLLDVTLVRQMLGEGEAQPAPSSAPYNRQA